MKHPCILFWGILLLLCQGVHAKTLHLILLINTEEKKRAVDRTADFTNMKQFWKEQAEIMGIGFSCTHLGKEDFYTEKVLEKCRQLSVVRNEDIVIFYYSGHGENSRPSKWPVFKLTDGKLDIREIAKILNNKYAKFSLVIGDCCNKRDDMELDGVSNNPPQKEWVTQLFYGFEKRKVGIVTASSVNESSRSHEVAGSIWSYAFRKVFSEETNNAQQTAPSWNTILEKTKVVAYQTTGGTQTAVYDVQWADGVGSPDEQD